MLVAAVGASVVAFVLLLPWSASVLGSRSATLGSPRAGRPSRPRAAAPLRHRSGRSRRRSAGPCSCVAALPLFIGRGWRLAWAARLWMVAMVFFWLTWAGLRGWIPALPAEVGLAPAAAALAGSAALGAVAFELDLPGYRFGWRQLAAGRGRRGPGGGGHPHADRLGAGALAPAHRRRQLRPGLPAGQPDAATTGSSGSGRPTPCRWPARPLDSGHRPTPRRYNGEPGLGRPVDHRPGRGHPAAGRRPAPGRGPPDDQARPPPGAPGGPLPRGPQPQRPGRLWGRRPCPTPGAAPGRPAAADRPAGASTSTPTTPCTRTRPGPRPRAVLPAAAPRGRGRGCRPAPGPCSRPI